jgi:site-specific DNA-methyltransferase (adenine-specific)
MAITWHTETRKLKDLKDFSNNPRKIGKEEFDNLVRSLKEDGYHQRLLINVDGTIIGGHQRKKALLKAGFTNDSELEVLVPDKLLEGKDFERINIRDNLPFGSFDFDILSSHFDSEQLIDWGMPEDWLIGAEVKEIEATEADNEVPELKEDATTKLGDVWLLGEHRLMCGDSTVITDVEKLLDGIKVDVCFTSPPYDVGVNQRLNKQNLTNSKYQDYEDNLNDKEYFNLLSGFTINALMCSSLLIVNIQQLAGNKVVFIEYLHKFKENIIDIAIWDKENAQPAMAENVLNSRFEYLIFISPENKPTRAIKSGNFRGTIDNVYCAKRGEVNKFSKEHAATFPVHLPLWAITNFESSGKGVIYDPFGGSGTTLIACEKSKRKCLMMELSPHYCDVIIARWEKHTNRKAELLPS